MGVRTDSARPFDGGFTLIELLIVIVVLGTLATIVVTSVRGIVDRGEQASCADDARVLSVAVEAYFAQQGGDTIPASGVDADRYERGLMGDGLLRETSSLYDLNVSGDVVVSPTSRCTTV